MRVAVGKRPLRASCWSCSVTPVLLPGVAEPGGSWAMVHSLLEFLLRPKPQGRAAGGV